MEIRNRIGLFLVCVVMGSLVISGCSRQLHTAIIGSEEEPGRGLADRLVSTFPSEEYPSLSRQYPEDDQLKGAGLDIPVEPPPQPSRVDAEVPSEISKGIDQGISRAPGEDDFPQPGKATPPSTTAIVPSDLDELTPLAEDDFLGDIAAASGTEAPPEKAEDVLAPLDQISPLGKRILGDVFFDFDQALIRSDAKSILVANADVLRARHENKPLLIEGHCDERGTVEYNLVLGERRAHATKQYLVDLGVPASTIQTVSYGKEKPFCTASNPNCWKQNRRGHFVLQ